MRIKENAMLIILRARDLIEKGNDKYIAYKIAAKEVLEYEGDEINE